MVVVATGIGAGIGGQISVAFAFGKYFLVTGDAVIDWLCHAHFSGEFRLMFLMAVKAFGCIQNCQFGRIAGVRKFFLTVGIIHGFQLAGVAILAFLLDAGIPCKAVAVAAMASQLNLVMRVAKWSRLQQTFIFTGKPLPAKNGNQSTYYHKGK
nr:hypothetical protein [Permianibacter aggregans]